MHLSPFCAFSSSFLVGEEKLELGLKIFSCQANIIITVIGWFLWHFASNQVPLETRSPLDAPIASFSIYTIQNWLLISCISYSCIYCFICPSCWATFHVSVHMTPTSYHPLQCFRKGHVLCFIRSWVFKKMTATHLAFCYEKTYNGAFFAKKYTNRHLSHLLKPQGYCNLHITSF